jgi:hypothetical protein
MKVLNSHEAGKTDFQAWKVGELNGIKYSDLVRIFGEPTYNEPSDDGKTQVEWWIKLDSNYFTVYDWKTYDREYTLNELEYWSIGGSTNPSKLIEFVNNSK